jgi:hypothetical protein
MAVFAVAAGAANSTNYLILLHFVPWHGGCNAYLGNLAWESELPDVWQGLPREGQDVCQ